MTKFEFDVYDAVKRIPGGRVASYRQIASMAGKPGAARAVGNILHKNPRPLDVPCFRVVHADGKLASGFAFGGIYEQKKRLEEDGIEVVNFKVDMEIYRIKSTKLVIFDFDGTLLDTLDDLADSVNFSLNKFGLPQRSIDEIRSFVGNGIRLLVERAVPKGTDAGSVNTVFECFKDHYRDNCAVKTKAYAGIIPLLKKLRASGIKIAVVSNKADFALQLLCEKYFTGLVDYAAGEKEGIRKKPNPDMVLGALNNFGVDRENALYIGDSEVDIQTAQNAGLELVAVSWGFRSYEALQRAGAVNIIESPADLEKYIFL